jgi:hypothetical protein
MSSRKEKAESLETDLGELQFLRSHPICMIARTNFPEKNVPPTVPGPKPVPAPDPEPEPGSDPDVFPPGPGRGPDPDRLPTPNPLPEPMPMYHSG